MGVIFSESGGLRRRETEKTGITKRSKEKKERKDPNNVRSIIVSHNKEAETILKKLRGDLTPKRKAIYESRYSFIVGKLLPKFKNKLQEMISEA